MLPLHDLADWARLRASTRLQEVGKTKADAARMYAAAQQLFHERVLDACRRVSDRPAAFPDAAFVALPERLFAKISYLCIGQTRSAKASPERPAAVSEAAVSLLQQYDRVGGDTYFVHLESIPQMERLKHVLVCHGLSPIGDSILLLAEIGRVSRLAWALGLPWHVMLADISWMSSNRSIRQFSTLSEQTIDTGLRVCLDKRRRLYDALNATPHLREITPYDRANAISRTKLRQISEHYRALVESLWGEAATGKLEYSQVQAISAPLDQAILREATSLPTHIRVLGQFPRTLSALEHELKPHLEILRTIAKQFNTFDDEVFTYFFAQYYAQQSYKGAAIKVAPISERRFDEPFDTLDEYFQAWGEGHSTTNIGAGNVTGKSGPPLSAAYLPQYQIGNLKMLPYTPLSLDAHHLTEKDHKLVESSMLGLDDRELESARVVELLRDTPIVNRNRLVSDLVSFIQLCVRLWGEKGLAQPCRALHYPDFPTFLNSLPPLLAESFRQELDLHTSESVREMWDTWLKATEVERKPTYVPAHVYFLLADEADWTESLLVSASQIVQLARFVYQGVV
jgi:hypothetical protein